MPLLPNVAGLVDRLNIGPLIVDRYGPKTQNARGGFDTPAPVTFQLNPVVAHNLEGRDLDQVPEADRNSEIVQFYTKQRLFVSDGGQLPDVVTYNSRRYRVIKVRDFDIQGGVFCSLGALEDLQARP